jgi:hypothetical protein
MILHSVWEFLIGVFRRHKSAPPTPTEPVRKDRRDPSSWRSSRRTVEAEVGAITTVSSSRSAELLTGRNCDLCSDRLGGREALITHYLKAHEVPTGIRGGGTGGIECPACHYEYELMAEQVLHYVSTHSG